MDCRVVAVVVTYNRKDLLLKCLAAVEDQTWPIDRLVVVDNSSTDGTGAALNERSGHSSKVKYIRLETNTGGAGGFNVALAEALNLGADWVWMMDDDVLPEADCLEKLMGYRSISECIHPLRISPDGTSYPWEQMIDISTGSRTELPNLSFDNGKDVTFTNVACFEGALISRRIIETVGLPDPTYFIGEDDTLFGVKASTHTNVAFVRQARMQRQLPPSGMKPWRAYYKIRNRFLLVHDCNNYLGLTPSRTQRAAFYFAQLLEAGQLVRLGPSYVLPVVRGLRDGARYLRGQ